MIPVYNLQDYIGECLDSCLNQDFDDYEIICVDDGSKDNSAEILDRYAKQYPEKIKVFYKENSGVSATRNKGIEYITGDWVWFVDGDDCIAPNCIKLFAENLAPDDDFVIFDFEKDVNNMLEEIKPEELKSIKLPYEKSFNTFASKSLAGGCWAHWFKKDILIDGNIKFDEGMKYSEDVKVIFQYKLLAKNGGRLFDNTAYFYRDRPSSATHKVDYEHQIYCMNNLIELCRSAMISNPELNNIFLNKQNQAMKVIQFNLMFKIRDYKRACEQINEWEKQGIYPYKKPNVKKQKRRKTNSGIKYRMYDMLKKTFRFKPIYLLLCKIFSKK